MNKALNLKRRIKQVERKAQERADKLASRGTLERGTMPPPTIKHRDKTRYTRKQKHRKNWA